MVTLHIFFLLDLMVLYMYITYLYYYSNVNCGWIQQTPVIHLQFKEGFCEALLEGWEMWDPSPCELPPLPKRPITCTRNYIEICRPCVVCHV